jgi:hypothetical protein
MFKVLDDLSCQLFHGQWAEVVSYSRQGAWRCTKPGCASQARHDRRVARARQHLTARSVARVPQPRPAPTHRAA